MLIESIFLPNRHARLYTAIINRAVSRGQPFGYTEKHHILPLSLGGNNSPSNLVMLTGREHFLCHRLLIKALRDPNHVNKMKQAFLLMISPSSTSQRTRIINARQYEAFRRDAAEACRQLMIARWESGKMANVCKPRSEEFGENLSKVQTELWANMTSAEREERSQINRKNGASAYINLTPEEVAVHSAASSIGSRKFWDNLTPDQLIEWKAKVYASQPSKDEKTETAKKAWINMDPAVKLARNEKIRQAKLEYWKRKRALGS